MAGRRQPKMYRTDSQEPGIVRSATLSSIFSLDPTEEEPVRRISTTSQPRVSLLLNHPSHKEDPPLKYHPLMSFSFIVKMVQALISLVCAGMYSEVGKLTVFSISTQIFPNIVFSSFLIITPVILLSYVLGQKMPELLIRIFNVLGCILYMVNFLLHITIYCTQFQKQWADLESSLHENKTKLDMVEYETDMQSEGPPPDSVVAMFFAVTALCLVNCILYLADVVFSIKRTLSYL